MSRSTAPALADVTRLSAVALEHSLRIAVVESLTSGGLAHAIGAGDRASEWFAGGIVAYRQEIKENVLGVRAGTDPCSPECAEQLSVGGRALFGADVCVATTGVGGPESKGGHAPGTVYVGWAARSDRGHRLLALEGPPDEVMAASIDHAIGLLVERCHRLAPSDGAYLQPAGLS